MKQGAILNRIVMFLFFAAILAYFAGAAWRGLLDPYPTVQVYTYSVDDTMETTGYLIRREQAISGSGSIVRLIPAEGEKVAAGATVAYLYADQLSLERSQRLEDLQAETAQLTQAIAAAGESGQEETSRERVMDAMVTLRSAVAAGDFTRLESQTSSFKSAVYQQAQRYGDAGALSDALIAAQAEMESLRAQTQDVGRVTVAQSGIFSGQVDGYEAILTPDGLDALNPSKLSSLENQALPVGEESLGKLITDTTWYFACALSEENAGRLTEGSQVTVRFSRDWAGEVDMTVERISAPEEGQMAVILSSHRFLSDVTLLRRQTVELVFEARQGLRVPTAAVRMEEGQSVVYVQVGVKAEKKPVSVLAQGEDFYLVEPVLGQDAETKEEKMALRAGDAVIVASEEIWDGKIVA